MINQQELDEIIYQELKAFNLSIGWIDPDTCDTYDEFESNGDLLHFELSDMMYTRIEKDTCLDDKSVNLWQSIVLYVEEHEPYEDWVNFSHEFKLPDLLCLESVKSFTESFKEAIVCSYAKMKLQQLREKIRLPHELSEEQLLAMYEGESVTIKFNLKDWDCKVIDIKQYKDNDIRVVVFFIAFLFYEYFTM